MKGNQLDYMLNWTQLEYNMDLIGLELTLQQNRFGCTC